jgi:RsmE family RNA methyltransferase
MSLIFCNYVIFMISSIIFVSFSLRQGYAFTRNHGTKARAKTSLALNRVLFASEEISKATDGQMHVYLNYDDYRSNHLYKVLQVNAGETFKAGVLGKGMTDEAKVMHIDDSVARVSVNTRDRNIAKAALKSKEVVKSVCKQASGSFLSVSLGVTSSLQCNEIPPVDLLLACPRPVRLERLLPVIACMGIGRLILVGSSKVEKSYWGSQLFRKPQKVQNLLEEGLSQACCEYRVPEVVIERKLNHIFDAMDTLFPREQYQRVIAHPPRPSDAAVVPGESGLVPMRMTQLVPLEGDTRRLVVAIGPEGGWTALELQRFLSSSFLPVHAGPRVLRTDMAVPALLALAHEYVALSR